MISAELPRSYASSRNLILIRIRDKAAYNIFEL